MVTSLELSAEELSLLQEVHRKSKQQILCRNVAASSVDDKSGTLTKLKERGLLKALPDGMYLPTKYGAQQLSLVLRLNDALRVSWLADGFRLLFAIVFAFVAIATFFPLLVILGLGDAGDYWNKWREHLVGDLSYVAYVVENAALPAFLPQVLLSLVRKSTWGLPLYERALRVSAPLASILLVVALESLPFISVVIALFYYQREYMLDSFSTGPFVIVKWPALVLTVFVGGCAGWLRLNAPHIRAALMPIRLLLIMSQMAIVALISLVVTGPDYRQGWRAGEVQILLEPVSLLSAATFVVVFLWCAHIKWIKRVSPWAS